MEQQSVRTKLKILSNVPNTICYFRLVLLFFMHVLYWEKTEIFHQTLNVFTQASDQILFSSNQNYGNNASFTKSKCFWARKLKQVSTFGASLDVITDNISRQLLWVRLSPMVGTFVGTIEWLVFAATVSERSTWKTSYYADAPRFIKSVVANNFKSPIGFFVISGLFFLPLHLFLVHRLWQFKQNIAVSGIFLYLLGGRLACLFCECWVICKFVDSMLNEDIKKPVKNLL